MAQYTIEDIEILRQKSGISYEEAVNLLEYHNGSLARALVDLEKNGRIKDGKSSTQRTAGHKGKGILTTLYRFRVKATRGNTTIVNLSSLFAIFTLLAAPWVFVIGLILCFVLGYRLSFDRDSRDFAGDTFESVVQNASTNVKSGVFNVAKEIGVVGGKGESRQPAQESRTESPASGTTPVNVQFPEDGRVNVSEDSDGYHEADIQ